MELLRGDYITRTYLGEALIQGILTGVGGRGARPAQEWPGRYRASLGTGAGVSGRKET